MFCDMSGKTFVIIGATSGVGRSVALSLSSLGAKLVLTGRSEEKLNRLASELDTAYYSIVISAENENYEAQLDSGLNHAKTTLGVDTFNGGVYCAGISPLLPLRTLTEADIDKVMRVNYTCAVLSAKLLAGKAHRTNGSSIVLISSVCSHAGEKGLGIYGASKAALEASARAFAREIAPYGVRINCVCPGWLDTNMNRENGALVAGLEQKMKDSHPLGLGSARDVSSAVAFLLSDGAQWITGTNIVVDGGFLA